MDIRRAASTGAVTVHLPASIAFDFDRLVAVQKDLFERLGHSGCYSGADVRFKLEEEWWVTEAGQLRNVPSAELAGRPG